MRSPTCLAVGILLLHCAGCESEPGNPVSGAKPSPSVKTTKSSPAGTNLSRGPRSSSKTFLNQTKKVPARREWTREVNSRNGGAISFRVASQGPFAVTIVTDQAFKALQSGKAPDKSDLLLTIDSPEATYPGKVTIPAGSSWFIIENQTDKEVEFRLECSDAG
jgi:hypothetical protein